METRGELEYLVKVGVDLFQGYYIAYPELKVEGISAEKRKEILEMGKNALKPGGKLKK